MLIAARVGPKRRVLMARGGSLRGAFGAFAEAFRRSYGDKRPWDVWGEDVPRKIVLCSLYGRFTGGALVKVEGGEP